MVLECYKLFELWYIKINIKYMSMWKYKKNIKKNIGIKNNKIEKEKDKIKVKIEKFSLEKENETDLMNIASLNFTFLDKNKNVLDEKKLIVQIFRERNDIFKNII